MTMYFYPVGGYLAQKNLPANILQWHGDGQNITALKCLNNNNSLKNFNHGHSHPSLESQTPDQGSGKRARNP